LKTFLQKIFNPILAYFERDSQKYRPASWKRPVLLVVSLIFIVLAIAVPIVAPANVRSGAWLPTIVFGTIGFTGFIVGTLGSNHAVAKLLGGL
jgi:lipopolysaccharide export LptBFGC system permease protein LptF